MLLFAIDLELKYNSHILKGGLYMLKFLIAMLFNQSIWVVSPNGGERWFVGNKYPIHWNFTGTSIRNVRIDYSIDGGQNWLTITTSTANDGDYLWTVPNNVSSNCFIRIQSTANPDIYDISDASFSIVRPTIEIRKPNGGEVLRVGEYYPIHWIWSGQFTTVKIEYSIDGGNTWNNIVTSTPNDGDHYWRVPNTPSDRCLIKVTNTGDPECFDISDNYFTIAPNTITVKYPNGGESFITGKIYPINWDWTGSFSQVKIEYSLDGGNTWSSITSSTTNDGSHYWTIPNTPSNNCLIKISDVSNPNCYDISDVSFSIQPTSIQLLTPNGGERYTVGDVCAIHWNWQGTISNVKIEYSTDGGNTWTTIVSSTPNQGSYLWNIPNLPTDSCKIRVSSVSDPNCFDVSDANFKIERPSFTIFDPDSGAELIAGEIYPIHWNWKGNVSSVKLELWYRTEAGVQWWTISPNTSNDGSHYFTVPYYISDSCGIKITSNDDPNAYSLSKVFKIVRPTIKVVYPNGGERIMEGEDMEILWTSNGNFSNVMIQYSTDGGYNWQTITTRTPNDGSYHWNAPAAVSPQCLIKISNADDINCFDVSDAPFFIYPDTITVVRPANGDTIFRQHYHPIYWKSLGGFPYATIEYGPIGSGDYIIIYNNVPNTGNYLWYTSQPQVTPGSNRHLILRSLLNPMTHDTSGAFTVADYPTEGESLRVLAPLGGDTFTVGDKIYITWHWALPSSYQYAYIYYSTDDGASWNLITTVSGNSAQYQWTIPNIVSDRWRIKVEASSNKYSISGRFTVVPQRIKILSPDSLKRWTVGNRYFILWNWTGGFSNAVIDYSYDNQRTWVTIASSTQNDGEYEWTVPNTPSESCFVRIRNQENLNVVAISNRFVIEPQKIFVTSPVKQDSLYAGNKYYITWDNTGAFSNVNLEYSIDGGVTWISIATNVSNNQSYEWTIPHTPSNTAMVRVINAANTRCFGVSDTFVILPQKIEVTSPTSNSQWIVGRKYYITWKNMGTFNNAKIEYSYDGGANWSTVASGISNTRYYQWEIPNTPSNNCLVKVSNADNINVYGISESFGIPVQAINITFPRQSDSLISGMKYYITWNWEGRVDYVDIYYSVDNGSTWTAAVTNASNNGYFEWTVPTANSNTCFVKVVSSQNQNVYGMVGSFTILPQQITITSPTYTDTLICGSKYYITWRAKGSFNNADLWYSTDGGQNWSVIATNVTNSGYYEWTLPEVFSNNAKIKIANSSMTSVSYAHSDLFVISKPILRFTSPDSGSVWYKNRKYYISWEQIGNISQVNLYYSLDGGVSWVQIATNQPNQGNYEWSLGDISSENARIKLVSSANSQIYYVSDSFVILVDVPVEESSSLTLPKKFALEGFSPNPVLRDAVIRLAVPERSEVKLEVCDAMGRVVDRVFEGYVDPGYHSYTYRCDLPKGVYFLVFRAKAENGKVYSHLVKFLRM
jgi:hypothetical protein